MSAKKYIALKSIQLVDADGARRSIEPRVEGKVSGLFEHSFSAKDEKRLIRLGAIREPEGTEEHEKPTAVETMDDTREGADANADAGTGKKAAATKASAKAETPAKGDGEDLLKS